MTNQPKSSSAPTPYHSYLIRLWKDGAEALWRGSAQSVQTGEIIRFANLTALFTFLESQTEESSSDEHRGGWRRPPESQPKAQVNDESAQRTNQKKP